MKKIIIFLGITLLVGLSGCTSSTAPETTQDAAPDLTTLYAQVCEVKEGPCTNMMCSLQSSGIYQCAEGVAQVGQNCAPAKSLDDVISQYQICGKENATALSIFNYGQSLETINSGMTPAELETKIKEETAIVENGGTSSFLSTMLATAGGMVLGGMISNALFNRPNAMPPARPASAYEQPLNKDQLNKAKTDTAANSSKVQNAVKQSRTNAAKKSSTSSQNTKKTNTTNSTKSTIKKRR